MLTLQEGMTSKPMIVFALVFAVVCSLISQPVIDNYVIHMKYVYIPITAVVRITRFLVGVVQNSSKTYLSLRSVKPACNPSLIGPHPNTFHLDPCTCIYMYNIIRLS